MNPAIASLGAAPADSIGESLHRRSGRGQVSRRPVMGHQLVHQCPGQGHDRLQLQWVADNHPVLEPCQAADSRGRHRLTGLVDDEPAQ